MRTSIVCLALAALACSKSTPARSPSSETTTTVATYDPSLVRRPAEPVPSGPQDMLEPSAAALDSAQADRPFTELRTPDSASLAKTDRPLSDAEILGVAVAANDGELQMAEVAVKRATNDDVKQFAARMKAHHGAALQKGKQLEARTKLTNAESDVSAYLKSEVATTVKDLKDHEGKAFDRAYVASQVKAHREVLSAIDNRLVSSASNGEVKAMVLEMRRTVADHLTKAEELQKKIGASPNGAARAGARLTAQKTR